MMMRKIEGGRLFEYIPNRWHEIQCGVWELGLGGRLYGLYDIDNESYGGLY